MLGEGGMGEVWRAHDTVTARVVAIKVLSAKLSKDEQFQRRFRREAQAAARLETPHVVPIYDYGEIDGRLFVCMRLINGRDLDVVLADGPLDPARSVRIIGQVAEALHAAHEIGLIHRDIKPSNILLDDRDFAYLIDFGIARLADDTRITKTGNTIGTFAYIAPERLDGPGEEDARVDIYSLTCVLYECLTGQPPFAADTMPRLIVAHMNAPPPRPSIARPDVPVQVDEVIATGMAKDPKHRYATTVELADAARYAITEPIARPATSAPTLPTTEPAPLPVAAPAPNHSPAQPVTQKAESPAPAWPAPRQPALLERGVRGANRRAQFLFGAIALLGVVTVVVALVTRHAPETTSSPPAPSTATSATSASSSPTPPASQSHTTPWNPAAVYIVELFPGLLPATPDQPGYNGVRGCQYFNVQNEDSVQCPAAVDPYMVINCNQSHAAYAFEEGFNPQYWREFHTESWTRPSSSGTLKRATFHDPTGTTVGWLWVHFNGPARNFCEVSVRGLPTGQDLYDSWFPNAPL